MKDIFQKIEYHYDFCLVFMSLINHWFVGMIEKMVGLPKPGDSIDLWIHQLIVEKLKLTMVFVWMIPQSLSMGLLKGRYALS
jgi:hypothetical protein